MNRKERRKQKKSTDQVSNLHDELIRAIDLHTKKNYSAAETIYTKIISIDQNNYQGLRHLGILYHDTKKYEKATELLNRAIKIQPSVPDAYNNLGLIHFVNDEFAIARDLFEQSFLLNNNYLPALNNLTRAYFKMNENDKCMQSALQALRLAPNSYICKLNHALALSINGKLKEGVQILELLKKENITDDLLNQLALMYEVSGDIENSNKYLLESFRLNENNYAMLAKLMENNVMSEKDLNYNLEQKYEDDSLMSLKEKSFLARCLYISHNKKGDFQFAGKYLVESNKLRDASLKYNIKNDEYFVDLLINKFDQKKIITGNKNSLKKKKPVPIFILGMPRSGTTLTEQILASHSNVHGGGELDYVCNSLGIDRIYDLPKEEADRTIKKLSNYNEEEWLKIGNKYVSKIDEINLNDKDFVTDKMPHNFMMCGIIHKMLPDAKIIYCFRDPMNNCFSLYKNTFGTSGHGYSYDQLKLSVHYNLHVKLMKHWKKVLGDKIFLLKNENLIKDQEGVTKNLLEHCNLKWESNCLEFYKTERDIRTISLRQVRNPINTNSLGVWKKYEDSLSEMQKSLEEFS